jgi:O-acetyl-ADP-ribose deacetylase (regulator of RNase III)
MKHVDGDLLKLTDEEAQFDVMVHGCNCFHTQGSGIAGQVSRKYPTVLEVDKTSAYGDYSKLGSFTCARISREDGSIFTVVNLYSQFHFGKKHAKDVLVDYDAVNLGFERIVKAFPGQRIGICKIGSDLAGGDWDKLHDGIAKATVGADITVVTFAPQVKA